jgi:hypothetical protein
VPWEEGGVFLDGPVPDLRAWAQKAANSDLFARNLANMFWVQSLGHGPTPDDEAEFQDLWRALPVDGYSANRMLHRLIDTHAFGVP